MVCLVIRAPRDGTIFRMPLYEQGQTIRESETKLTLIPDSSQEAVELRGNGNDMAQMGYEDVMLIDRLPTL